MILVNSRCSDRGRSKNRTAWITFCSQFQGRNARPLLLAWGAVWYKSWRICFGSIQSCPAWIMYEYDVTYWRSNLSSWKSIIHRWVMKNPYFPRFSQFSQFRFWEEPSGPTASHHGIMGPCWVQLCEFAGRGGQGQRCAGGTLSLCNQRKSMIDWTSMICFFQR